MSREVLDFLRENNIDVTDVPTNRKYWLIRAQSGEFFDEFYENDYVGINWNEFSSENMFSDEKKDETVERIANSYPDNKQPSHTFGQIKRFYEELNIGDVVMVPNKNSRFIAFGLITSEVYAESVSETAIDEGDCPFIKRRSVEWIKLVKRSKLDPVLFRMMQAHATISNATDYQDYIDRTMYSYFCKGNSSYFVLEVDQEDDIPLIDMVEALQAPLDLAKVIENPVTKENYCKDDLVAKFRVQSIGTIAFISTGSAFGLALLLGIAMIAVVGGTIKFSHTGEKSEAEATTEGLLEKILKFKDQNHKQDMEKIEHGLVEGKRKLKMVLPKEIVEELPEEIEGEGTEEDNKE